MTFRRSALELAPFGLLVVGTRVRVFNLSTGRMESGTIVIVDDYRTDKTVQIPTSSCVDYEILFDEVHGVLGRVQRAVPYTRCVVADGDE